MVQSFQYNLKKQQTIDQLLRDDWQLGKKLVHELRMAKAISNTDGEPIPWQSVYEKGFPITITLQSPESSYLCVPSCELPILFEDEHCLVVSKSAGMKTHPNDDKDTDTCMNHVITHIRANGGIYAEHVHRLDEGTSGLVLVAKHPIAKAILDRMLEEKKIVRTYEALVQGIVKNKEGTIRANIGKDRHHATRKRISPTGQTAITHYQVVKKETDASVLHLQLDTGRTHQIRVHVAHIGHPIVGDTLYGGRKTKNGHYHLRAIRLAFKHPFTGEEIMVSDC